MSGAKMISQYEQLRKQNIEDNKRILAELGLLNPFKPLGRVVKKSVKRKRSSGERKEWTPKRPAVEDSQENCDSPVRGSRRRSSRLQGKDALTADELKDEVEKFVEEEESYRPKIQPNRPNVYGPIPGVEVGTVWKMRMDACRAGVHRPPVSGIHGGEEGCYSIALSGGYEDDIDLGECFTYTGEGGRDLKGTKSNPKNLRTAAQSKDQTLTRGNLALYQNIESGHTVRVIRGYKLPSPFAPEEGYRYDGVYTVEKAWFTTGLSGFGVWKFALRRCKDQAPPPWSIIERDSQNDETNQSAENKALFQNPTSEASSTNKSKTEEKVEAVESATDESTDQQNGSTDEQIEDSSDNKQNSSIDEQKQDSTNKKQNDSAEEQKQDSADKEGKGSTDGHQNDLTGDQYDYSTDKPQHDQTEVEGIPNSQKTASPSSDSEIDAGLCPTDSQNMSLRSV